MSGKKETFNVLFEYCSIIESAKDSNTQDKYFNELLEYIKYNKVIPECEKFKSILDSDLKEMNLDFSSDAFEVSRIYSSIIGKRLK